MRQIVLDTETTGLEPNLGHRIIEIGGVELVNRQATGNNFHRYFNPERDSEVGALDVHGLTSEFLADKPKFQDTVKDVHDYVNGAELVIHNSAFDIAFLDRELGLADMQPMCGYCAGVVDTLRLARELHPGKRNSLDALCERYQVDNSARTMHGALLDAQLLAEVYLAMTRGQESLVMEVEVLSAFVAVEAAAGQLELLVLAATADELAAHTLQLEAIDRASKGACLWRRLEA
jgi:DNA polymerase-3 subunit epsilon